MVEYCRTSGFIGKPIDNTGSASGHGGGHSHGTGQGHGYVEEHHYGTEHGGGYGGYRGNYWGKYWLEMAFKIFKNYLFESELPDFWIFLVNLFLVNHVEIKCLGKIAYMWRNP